MIDMILMFISGLFAGILAFDIFIVYQQKETKNKGE